VALTYFIFKLVRMYTAETKRKDEYAPARKTLTVFAVITIVFLVITIIIACWCALNFNKGLKPHISKTSRIREEIEHNKFTMGDVSAGKYSDGGARNDWPSNSGGPGPGGHRMEID
jgi:uncharacterized membrane protein